MGKTKEYIFVLLDTAIAYTYDNIFLIIIFCYITVWLIMFLSIVMTSKREEIEINEDYNPLESIVKALLVGFLGLGVIFLSDILINIMLDFFE